MLIAALLFIFCQPGDGRGAVNSYTRNGNEFSTVSGQYLTATHCVTGDTCSWVAGAGLVLGVYYSNTPTVGPAARPCGSSR